MHIILCACFEKQQVYRWKTNRITVNDRGAGSDQSLHGYSVAVLDRSVQGRISLLIAPLKIN